MIKEIRFRLNADEAPSLPGAYAMGGRALPWLGAGGEDFSATRTVVSRACRIANIPPDVTAGIFWMKNRRPDLWRDTHQIEHQLGKYVISDHPIPRSKIDPNAKAGGGVFHTSAGTRLSRPETR
jgi:hypothetical protein